MKDYKVGDIIFFNGPGIYSKLIRFYNRLRYNDKGWSHCGIVTKVEKERMQIHEAIDRGFVKSFYPKWWVRVREVDGRCAHKRAKKRLKDVLIHAEKYLGRPYAWYDVISISLAMVLPKCMENLTGSKKLMCSEAVTRILYDASNKKIDFEKEFNKPYDSITPMDLYLSVQIDKIAT